MAVDDLSSSAKARASDLIAYGQRQVDRVVSPPTRQKAYDRVYDLSTERPILLVSFTYLLHTMYIHSYMSIWYLNRCD